MSLTAVMENLAQRAVMAELDQDVAAFWKAALHYTEELKEKVRDFSLSREAIEFLALQPPESIVSWGFRTLVLNRTRRGGILANGAALARVGENGKGIESRWYPDTIIKRLAGIARYANRIDFRETDGLGLLEDRLCNSGFETVVFADPPYTAGGKRAGRRLYNTNSIDHRRLFSILSNSRAEFLMTYDKSQEVLSLVKEYGFEAVEVQMKNTHHAKVPELVITRSPIFNT